ncbi:MAG: STAS/SEC14 domain-containing protein [Pirellulaceae bacterium]
MTIELIETPQTATLQVTASGKLSGDDYTTFEPAVNQLIESAGKIKILFVMQDFHGWEPGAVWEDIKFATKHCRDIDKIAMVGEKDWERWMATICKPFTMSKIQYFEAGEQDQAQQWLEA